ncbi:type IV secretion system protein [Brackiella oedipodis]|uniref:type IV secretion system protein n=1 Tax=Brackiella oedipodis TaxID=124225 RepID=UPI000685E2CD|nr:type IV secretion system protein [Brackiella oedipodis]
MKTTLVKTLIVSAIAFTSLQPSVHAQGIPTFDATAVLKYTEQIAQMKKQIENQIQQITELKNQVVALTGTRNMGNLLKNSVHEAIPDDWKMLYDQVGVGIADIQDPKKYDPKAAENNLTAIYQLTQDSLVKSQQITSDIESLMAEINNTKDIKAAADLQSRISAQQAALTLNQSNLDQAYRAFEINEQVIAERQTARDNCYLRAWAYGTDKSQCE